MIGSLAFLLFQSALSTASFNPHANELFDRDTALKAWALGKFDTNHDGWLTLYEAQPAIAAFREIAERYRPSGDQRGRHRPSELGRVRSLRVATSTVLMSMLESCLQGSRPKANVFPSGDQTGSLSSCSSETSS